ncbi:chemotaxis protein [Fulvimonas soli]|jgi:two-component system chemotaxis response regulator CheV|uniref:Two-component system chemotaxis response regulator CheV n=1 Tax=Fulvimonas soli TaxID=155197 RepID=A0A316HPE2_9GAMM|nr:chemotaxis protein [Fulvimonas soli]PWK83103.1 two-component system chemotaxis response regulator CheV [Fulvimonas soli]TNY25162.1 chemotaxis protein [Fulvimonas soli]
MSSAALLDNVERQTRLAGHNRVAMLLFRLGDAQLFGINVFKVREVMRRPPLERMPGAHALVAGSCDYRGQTIPVIDLAAAVGYPPLRDEPGAHLMVTEFSRSVQGFLVADLQRMVHCDGDSLSAPSAALGFGPRVNAVTRVDGALVAVIDVEHVLASIDAAPRELSAQMQRSASAHPLHPRRVLVADDSLIARRQLVNLFKQMNIECVVAQDGREALDRLNALADAPEDERVNLVVSDIEMPQLDGYALTRAIRETPALRRLKVVLHSSLSGVFNEAIVREVGADRFVAKFQPDVLAQAVIELLPVPSD